MSENADVPEKGREDPFKTDPSGRRPDHLPLWSNQAGEIGGSSYEKFEAFVTNSLIAQAIRVGGDATVTWLRDEIYSVQSDANGCVRLTTDQVAELHRISTDAAHAWLSARVDQLDDVAKDYMQQLSAEIARRSS